MIKNLIYIILAFVFPLNMAAQVLSGTVSDKRTDEPLLSATVGISGADGKMQYTATDMKGIFEFKNIKSSDYTLQISYVGYKTYTKNISVPQSGASIEIFMEEDVQSIGQVSVEARATRAQQKGDSLVYNAEAFKVMQGSTAEDLLSKMPGIVVEGGTVQAQGEDVKKVLVDGKEFFDGDVNLALKNLPSDVIASIEVFDKKSEQAEFSGFDDGEEIKTINIVTKAGYREGTFGEVYAGYGTDNRYRAGGNINLFNDDRRISILGMSNNVNQQNFSQEDLAGVMSSSQGGGRRGGRGGGGRGSGGGGGNSANNFMVGNLGGVTSSNGLGFNYVDQLSDKLKFTGSYFFNQSVNNKETNTDRQYFESVLPGLSYSEYNNSRMENWNHRINMKLDYQIDKNNSLQIKPNISFQNNDMTGFMQGINMNNSVAENEIQNTTGSNKNAYNIGTDVIFRHRFPVEGRTLSVMFNGKVSDKTGKTYNDYLDILYGATTTEDSYGQLKDINEKQYSLRGNVMFTEKLSDILQLQTSYKVSYSDTESDRKVFLRSPVNDLYEQLDENLSNVYESGYLTQAGALGLRLHKGGFNVMAGVDFQYSSLQGEQFYPTDEMIGKKYFTVLPSLTARYKLDRTNSFMLRYRSSSSSPSITDLQEVVDNTNPLFLSSGNPNLDQQINHSLNLRYIRTTASGHTFIGMLGTTLRTGYVSDSTFVATENITLPSGISMDKGAQYTKPVNMDGYYSLQSMITYGFPIDFIRSNVNVSFSTNYANVPSIFNGVKNRTKELNLIPKIVVGSNISHNLDFTLSYSATLNNIFSSLENSSSSNYVFHLGAAKIGWTFWKGFTLRSSFSYQNYAGLDMDDSDYFLWNISLGKKFLKRNQAEIKLEAFDVLCQNQAFTHQTGSNYYDYVRSNVLKPYLMLSFVYTIR